MDYGSVWLSVAGALVALIIFATSGGGASEPFALAISLIAIALSRRFMWTGLAFTLVAVAVAAITTPPIVEWTIVVFTLFSICLRGASALRAGVVAAVVTYLALVYSGGAGLANSAALTSLVTFVAAAAMGSAIRSHQQYWHALEQRTSDAVANREAEAERRVAEERLRIARDLHDVVGHEIAVLSMHVGVAQVSLPPGADAARDALASARNGLQSVLRETQRILKVLRSVDDGDDVAAPLPDAALIPRMLTSFQVGGLNITMSGEVPQVADAAVSGTLFRLVQEVMTNANKHGDGSAELDIRQDGTTMVVTATNRKRDLMQSGVGGGLGLIGMRERVVSIGGRIMVTETNDMFRVEIVLPIDGGSPA